jgi:hypothetical protein
VKITRGEEYEKVYKWWLSWQDTIEKNGDKERNL